MPRLHSCRWSAAALVPRNMQQSGGCPGAEFRDGLSMHEKRPEPKLIDQLPRRPIRTDTDKMITKFMTEITARFNPFSACAKPARLFLTLLPPNARTSGTNISTTLLPRASTEPSSIAVKFKDGKELEFNTGKITIKGLVEEMDRHSRKLQKKADLTD
ncbi:hypothetical protein LLEC1_02304 [Akanthomyces lecanii]|uniref:Large ribosomal subunit protein mL53 n=1 Tax=Cordyceps confragosa TaxID=2714763 RepID=A0A179I683_CORDF|nr:hypothetical protein LLEC1_02304 [Akanthomyces lecanii]